MDNLEAISKLVSTLAVVAGVVVSALSYRAAQEAQASARKIEAAKPFLELRQKLYGEVLASAGVLANPDVHTPDEIAAANKRFRSLYVSELSMVESREVEQQMIELATQVAPDLVEDFTPAQTAAYRLSHKLRDSFVADWDVARN